MDKTANFFTLAGFIFADLFLEIIKMVLTFFPSMAKVTIKALLTAFVILFNLSFGIPVFTNYRS